MGHDLGPDSPRAPRYSCLTMFREHTVWSNHDRHHIRRNEERYGRVAALSLQRWGHDDRAQRLRTHSASGSQSDHSPELDGFYEQELDLGGCSDH